MNTRIQLICAWCGPIYIVMLAAGLLIAGILPPHSPTFTAVQVASIFQENPFRIRSGLLIAMWASALFIPFSAAVSVQLARIEGKFPALAWTQLAAAAGTTLAVALPIMFWEDTSFRPDRNPDLTLLMDDLANVLWGGMTTPYLLQPICIAIVGFTDKSDHPVFPRWACYLNLVELLLILPGGFIAFTKTGPIAWDGVLAITLPFTAWMVWFFSTTYLLIKGIKRQALAEQIARSA